MYFYNMKTLRRIAFLAITFSMVACNGNRIPMAEPAPKPSGNNSSNPQGGEQDRFIFDTDLFEEYKDASSGVVSYLLKSGVGDWECSQSNYFNARSMTDDERFIFFYGSNKDYSADAQRHGMILDLKTRKLYKVPNCHFSCHPYLDPKEDKLYYGYVYENKTRACFYRRDLLVDPSKDIKLVDLPSSLLQNLSDRPIKRLANHLTLTQDKKKVFLDMRLDDIFVYGLLDLTSGAWDEWGRANINLTHGQLNPLRDDIALMAVDSYTKLDGTKVDIEPENGVYPRLQIVKKGSREIMLPDMTRPDQPAGYASHERWDESGEYVYWCSAGACIRSLTHSDDFKKYDENNGATWASHAFFSKEREYITYDDQSLDFYRGCRWKVAFYNIKTRKMVYIHTLIPALVSKTEIQDATIANKMASLHPDPHPQFVCNDKYIICTAQRPDKTIRLSITPVEQLITKTK